MRKKDSKYISNKYNKERKYNNDRIVFSFKYLDLGDPMFCVDKCKAKYFLSLIERVKGLSSLYVKEFQRKTDSTLRNHVIDWKDVNKDSFGIPDEEELVEKPWQFSVSSNEHGRVMGFFTGNIFNIVWLDCEHNLYD